MSERLTDEQIRAEAARGGNFHSTSMAVELLAIRAELEKARGELKDAGDYYEGVLREVEAEREAARALLREAILFFPLLSNRQNKLDALRARIAKELGDDT